MTDILSLHEVVQIKLADGVRLPTDWIWIYDGIVYDTGEFCHCEVAEAINAKRYDSDNLPVFTGDYDKNGCLWVEEETNAECILYNDGGVCAYYSSMAKEYRVSGKKEAIREVLPFVIDKAQELGVTLVLGIPVTSHLIDVQQCHPSDAPSTNDVLEILNNGQKMKFAPADYDKAALWLMDECSVS